MEDQRRHPRVRFGHPPPIRIGYGGRTVEGGLINLSLSGLMVRTDLPMEVGRAFGCEFSLFNSPTIDVPAVIVNQQGNIYGARFQSGPLSEILIEAAMSAAMATGEASTVSVVRDGVLRILKVCGGLNGGLRNDFKYSLTQIGVDELDAHDVTAVDRDGVALCMFSVDKYQVRIGARSPCFERAWQEALRRPERISREKLWD